MDLENRELENLFADYRAAVPDPEASANFMPGLWRKIEARQSFVVRMKKMTQVFVAAAAAICLLLGIMLQMPVTNQPQMVSGNYVDALTDANPTDNLTAVGVRIDYTEPGR
jgi:hypothetical protein